MAFAIEPEFHHHAVDSIHGSFGDQAALSGAEPGLRPASINASASCSDLIEIGHNLDVAWTTCRDRGLEVGFPPGWLTFLNMQYGSPYIYRYWRQGIGWGMPETQKSVVDALHAGLTQVCGAIGDDGVQLELMTRTLPYVRQSP